MKTTVLVLATTIAIFLADFVSANDKDSTRVITKTVKIVDGNKVVVDTTFVFKGDEFEPFFDQPMDDSPCPMMSKMKPPYRGAMMRMNNNDKKRQFEADSDSSKVFERRHPERMMRDFKFDHNQMEQPENMPWMFGDKNFTPMPRLPEMQERQKGNLIDLNAPDIISFNREETKDGNEKITIIRKKKDK